MEDFELEELPVHELKRMCKEKHPNIKLKNTYKKDQIIDIMLTGKSPEPEERKAKPAPILKHDGKKTAPIMPEEIMPELNRLKEQGLEWEVDQEVGCVTFKLPLGGFDVVIDKATNKPKIDPLTNSVVRKPIVLMSCANLDQGANKILQAALDCFPKGRPVEMSRGERHAILD